MFRGKKGGEKYLSLWWFLVLIMITGSIVIAVSAFNIADVSTKEIESDILISRFVDCIVDAGVLNQKFLDKDFNIFEKCYLNKEIIDKKGGKHYLGYEVYDFKNCDIIKGKTSCKNPIIQEKFGVAVFETNCHLPGGHFPLCSEKYVYVLSEKGKKLIMRIKAGSNQLIKQEN
tara:strand:+ start:273 stop:791 length:519 start_codon:yes stop_codon:yes gene_type:complete